jgi:hypothetical protein
LEGGKERVKGSRKNYFLNSILHVLNTAFHAPPSIKESADDHAPDRQSSSNKKIDDIVVPQINGRENESTDNREKNIEEDSFIAVGQE